MNYLSTTFDKYDILSYEEEVKLLTAYRDNNDLDAARKIVLHHLRLVEKIVKRYLGYGLPKEDLFQEGLTGLMIAVKKFDLSKGIRFYNYAFSWARDKITEYVEKNWRIVKTVGGHASRKLFWNKGIVNNNTKKDADEILGVDTESFYLIDARDFSIHGTKTSDENELSPEEYLVSPEPTPEEALLNNEKPDITALLSKLKDRKKYIIQGRYLTEPAKTLKELALELNLSIERVRQIESAALKELKVLAANYE